MFPRVRITDPSWTPGILPGGRLELQWSLFRASASRKVPRMSPSCRFQPLHTIIWQESIRPICDTVGDSVDPLSHKSSMTSGSKYPRRHQRALNSSGLGRVTTWNETVSKLSLCFLCAFTGQVCALLPCSSSFFLSVSLAVQIKDFSCTCAPLSFPFLATPCTFWF